MTHVKQKDGLGSCGAVAYAAILGLSELQGIRECKTVMRGRRSGTNDDNVISAFSARGIKCYPVHGHEKLHTLFWIAPLSTHFPLYVVVREKRSSKSSHAIAIMNGQVYDGHFPSAIPLDVYPDVWFESMLVIDKELPTFQVKIP